MIASAHPLATQAGLQALREGGNAIDAGLAVNSVLNVTQPPCCGFGGDAFFLYYEAETGRVYGYNASGRAPLAATCETLKSRGHETMPTRGPLTVTVPGMADGWAHLHEQFGRRPWGAAFAAAIGYAREGHPVSDNVSGWITGSADTLRRCPAAVAAMLPHGQPPQPGERLRQPDLATTLEQLAADGAEVLYHGPLGQAIADGLRAADGLLNAADLAAHEGAWTEPLGLDYHGYQILVHGPNSQGWTLPLMLGLAREFPVFEPGSTAAVHLGLECKKLAFADRDAVNTDPERLPVEPAELLTEAYLAPRRALIRLDRAMPGPSPGCLEGDTTYFCVVDPDGNALSVVQSLFHGFGSGFMAPGTGLFLQNRGAYFSLDPAHINCLAPRKRTAHTLCATLVLQGGRPVIVPGTMGGDGQPQFLYQILTAMLDHGWNPQQAIELPRWAHGRGSSDLGSVNLESRFDPRVAAELRELGHRVDLLGDWSSACGHAQVIQITADGLAGGADPRGDGLAAGF